MNNQQPEKSGSKVWLIVLLVLALAAAGAAAWWFLLREPEKAPCPLTCARAECRKAANARSGTAQTG